MVQRVAVFIDYQNVYRRARDLFCRYSRSHVDGQVHPQRVGLKLRGPQGGDRELIAVRVYRGQPSSKHDPKGFGACDRQVDAWAKFDAIVQPILRPLNYRDPTNPREKGIDVRLAIDFVMMAQRGEYDVGIIFSEDTDLIPALESVIELRGQGSCEVASWHMSGMDSRRLRLPAHPLWAHKLSEQDYRHVHDPTDYTLPTRRR